MTESWVEIEGAGAPQRVELVGACTTFGRAGCDRALPGAPEGQLHVWSDPPKLVHVGGEVRPSVNGRAVEEAHLASGDRIAWGDARLRFRSRSSAGVLEEIPVEAPASAPAAAAAPPSGTEARAWARVRAGMLVEQGLTDKQSLRRWQDAVLRREFDADACARDLLAGSQVASDDPRLLDRSGRLLRDFVMTPLTQGVQGASRKIRGAARTGTAVVVAQTIAILVYTAIVLVVMLLSRLKWDVSFDRFFDTVLGR